MRVAMGAFGLVGLLITVGLLLYISSWNAQTVLQTSAPAKKMAEQLSGRNASGASVMTDLKLEPQMAGDQLRGLKVKSIAAGSEIEQYFGLKAGDNIVQAQLDFSSLMGDAEMASNMILDQYQKRGSIVVERNGQRLTLPQDKNSAVAAPGTPGTPTAAPKTPAAPGKSGDPLKDQIDLHALPGMP